MASKYTDDQIKQYVAALSAKGASPAEIESFVAAAKGVPVQGAAQAEAPANPFAEPAPAQAQAAPAANDGGIMSKVGNAFSWALKGTPEGPGPNDTVLPNGLRLGPDGMPKRGDNSPEALRYMMGLTPEGKAAQQARIESQIQQAGSVGTDMVTQGGMTGTGAKIGAMVPGVGKAFTIPLGAAAGSVAGYLTNQLRKSEPITTGGVAANAAAGAAGGFLPSTQAAFSAKIPFVKTPLEVPQGAVLPAAAAANAAINVGAANLENRIDNGEYLSAADSAVPAIMGAAGTLVGNRLDKGKTAAEQRSKANEDAPRERFRQKIIAEGGAFSPTFESESAANVNAGKLAKSSALTVDLQRKNMDWRNNKTKAFLEVPPDVNLAIRDQNTGDLVATKRFIQKQSEVYATIDEFAKQAQQDLADFEKPLLANVNGKQVVYLAGQDKATLERHAELTRKAAIDTRVLKQLQEDEKVYWKKYSQPDVPGGRDQWRDLALKAAEKQDQILQEMDKTFSLSMGKKQGAAASEVYKEARKNIAMAHILDDAIDTRGNVDPRVIYDQWKAGRKLTGPLEDIAKFYEFAPKVNGIPTQSHADARSGLGFAGVLSLGAAGAGTAGAAAHAAGLPPAMSTAVGLGAGGVSLLGAAPAAAALRGMMTSKFYQSRMTTPSYGANIPDYLAYSARSAISAQGLEALRKYEAKKFDAENPSPLLRR